MGATNIRAGRTALIAILIAIAAGCGNGSSAGDSAPEPGEEAGGPTTTTLPSCSEERRAVGFEIVGALMAVDQDFYDWIADVNAVPQVRPGAPELSHAYADKGYEIIYFTLAPSTLPVGDVMVSDALRQWLDTNGFAGGERTRIFAPSPDERIDQSAALGISDELVRERSEGVTVDYGYGNSEDKILAFQTGGIPAQHVYSLDVGAGSSGSTAIPGDDLVAHRATVDALPKVCG